MNTSKALTLFAVSTVGMVIFAVLYFSTSNTQVNRGTTQFVTNTVVNSYTNEIVKEVPKEIEKLVQVPAAIPDGYLIAMEMYQRITNSTYANQSQVMFDMKDISVECLSDSPIREVLSDDQVKAKFELTLRRNNVPINSDSKNIVRLYVEGVWDSMQNLLCYSVRCELVEQQLIVRNGQWRRAYVKVWSKGGEFGIVGKLKANNSLLDSIEKAAEIFANDYLAANPK